jgi:hypothetical protein
MVGDGGMGIYRADDNEVNVLGTPDGGEFAGQTRFLTMPEIFADNSFYKRIGFRIVSDFTAIILMSDGITDPKFQTSGKTSAAKMPIAPPFSLHLKTIMRQLNY